MFGGLLTKPRQLSEAGDDRPINQALLPLPTLHAKPHNAWFCHVFACCPTVAHDCSWMLGLQSLSIRQTLVSGTIPRELADLPYLESVDVRDTRMSCCGTLEVCAGGIFGCVGWHIRVLSTRTCWSDQTAVQQAEKGLPASHDSQILTHKLDMHTCSQVLPLLLPSARCCCGLLHMLLLLVSTGGSGAS
jgi:hypothetical protein